MVLQYLDFIEIWTTSYGAPVYRRSNLVPVLIRIRQCLKRLGQTNQNVTGLIFMHYTVKKCSIILSNKPEKIDESNKGQN